MSSPQDKLSLTGLRVDCIVGVYPSERHTPQPLEVDLTMHLDTRAAATDAKLKDTVDYARLWGEVRFVLHASRFLLLESAAEAIARYILAPPTQDVPRAQVQAVTVRLKKPHALGGAGIPSLEIFRTVDEEHYDVETKPFGEVDVIFTTHGCGIYRLRIQPGAAIPTHMHQVMDEAELVLGEGLLLQGKPVAAGSARHWPKGLAHRYDNPTQHELTVLCVDRPRFLPHDEIEVSETTFSDVDVMRYF